MLFDLFVCSPPLCVGGESPFISDHCFSECHFVTADQLQYLIKHKFLMCDIKEYGILEIIGEIHNSATTPKKEPILPNEYGVGWVTNIFWPFRPIEECYHIPSLGYLLP